MNNVNIIRKILDYPLHLAVLTIGNFIHPARLLFMPKMSSGVAGSEGAEKPHPASTDQTSAAAAEPQYADQSTRSLPDSKIVIVGRPQLKEKCSIESGVLTLT